MDTKEENPCKDIPDRGLSPFRSKRPEPPFEPDTPMDVSLIDPIRKLIDYKYKCDFVNAWAGQCEHEAVNEIEGLYEPLHLCDEHTGIKCTSCGEQATHTCHSTHLLVCGAPLCDSCEHKLNEFGTATSGHCRIVDQEYLPWLVQDAIDDMDQVEKEEFLEAVKISERFVSDKRSVVYCHPEIDSGAGHILAVEVLTSSRKGYYVSRYEQGEEGPVRKSNARVDKE